MQTLVYRAASTSGNGIFLDCYDEHGERGDLLAQCQLDEAGLQKQIDHFLNDGHLSAVEDKITGTQ